MRAEVCSRCERRDLCGDHLGPLWDHRGIGRDAQRSDLRLAALTAARLTTFGPRWVRQLEDRRRELRERLVGQVGQRARTGRASLASRVRCGRRSSRRLSLPAGPGHEGDKASKRFPGQGSRVEATESALCAAGLNAAEGHWQWPAPTSSGLLRVAPRHSRACPPMPAESAPPWLGPSGRAFRETRVNP
jgi:hypothetical protein